MSEKNRVEMPATGGGLFRPSDAEGQGIKFRPEQIIVFVAAVVVIEILLRLFIGTVFLNKIVQKAYYCTRSW